MTRATRHGALVIGLLMIAGPIAAQRPPRRAVLEQNIERLFLTQVTREMGLTEDQVGPFQRVVDLWAQKRAALEAQERQLRQSLAGELRPGVAANPDNVSRTVDGLNANRVAYAETFRDEMKDLTPILSPVQRGQFQVARDRLLQKVRDLQLQRQAAIGARGASPPEP
ncbi:MAG TPA: hypothetical protein VGL65_11790 [Gemmatimonadales bacterium]|jgi:hypothetical protein